MYLTQIYSCPTACSPEAIPAYLEASCFVKLYLDYKLTAVFTDHAAKESLDKICAGIETIIHGETLPL